MKNTHHRLIASLAIGACIAAGFSTVSAQTANNAGHPVVISPPAVNNGSNWSRAPFPAQRQFDDTKGPDAVAIDKVGPNSPSANIEPAPPPARVAILQPSPAPAVTAADPGLLPTGRTTVVTSSTIDARTFAPSIRSSALASRETIIADIEARMRTTENAMDNYRHSAGQMSTDGRRTFKAADDEVKDKASALKKSIRAARKANDAEWMAAREKLAADYEAYGAALARIDAAAGVGVTPVTP